MPALECGTTAWPVSCVSGQLTVERTRPDHIDLLTGDGERIQLDLPGLGQLIACARAAAGLEAPIPAWAPGQRAGLLDEVTAFGHRVDGSAAVLGVSVASGRVYVRVGSQRLALHRRDAEVLRTGLGSAIAAVYQ